MSTLIQLYCHDRELITAIRRALIAQCDLDVVTDFKHFAVIPDPAVCRVLVLCELANKHTFELLAKLVRWAGKPTIESAQPLVIIEKNGWPEHAFPDADYRRIPNRTINVSDISGDVWDAVLQEHARAALAMLTVWIEAAPHLTAPIRRALRSAVSLEDTVRSVTEDSEFAGCSRSTLHRHWAATGISGLSLSDIIGLILLLRLRARKTRYVSWANLAEECHVSAERIRRIERRLVGDWYSLDSGLKAIDFAAAFRKSLQLSLG